MKYAEVVIVAGLAAALMMMPACGGPALPSEEEAADLIADELAEAFEELNIDIDLDEDDIEGIEIGPLEGETCEVEFRIEAEGLSDRKVTIDLTYDADDAEWGIRAREARKIARRLLGTEEGREPPEPDAGAEETEPVEREDEVAEGDRTPLTREEPQAEPTESEVDPGGPCANAIPVSGGRAAGTASGIDRLYYSFVIERADIYSIFTENGVDTVGELLDENCSLIDLDDDSGPNANFLINQYLTPGTYYVAVRGYSALSRGEFTLRIFRGAVATDSSDEEPEPGPR